MAFRTASIETLTNEVQQDDEKTPIFIKKKSHSAPESDASNNSIYEKTPVPKKKLSLDSKELRKDMSTDTVKEFLKEKCQKQQEKDMDEASVCSSVDRVKTISPTATLTSVSLD